MEEFLNSTEFGKYINKVSEGTKRTWKKNRIYEITNQPNYPNLKKGNYFYFDSTHRDHIEVFDSNGLSKCVLNLDGTLNQAKTRLAEGRSIKSSLR